MSTLDDVPALAKLDSGSMLQQVAQFPNHLSRSAEVQAAFTGAHELAGMVAAGGAREVVVCGMGGSAIGADYAAVFPTRVGGVDNHRLSFLRWRSAAEK